MGNDPSSNVKCNNCPVESVSWNEAQEYIRNLNARSGLHYRLPTEAEWEYACRSNNISRFCGGDEINSLAWYKLNSNGKPNAVGQKAANSFGLYDMSGNISEWTCSGYGVRYDGGDICFEKDNYRPVSKGGSWFYNADAARAASRWPQDSPTFRSNNLGFRVAQD